MKMSYASWVLLTVAMTILMVNVMADDCSPGKLISCLPSIIGNTPPPSGSSCCKDLHSQESCLCKYVKDPISGPYLKMPGAKTVANACGVTIPDPNTCT